jgi:hypothetical protein
MGIFRECVGIVPGFLVMRRERELAEIGGIMEVSAVR